MANQPFKNRNIYTCFFRHMANLPKFQGRPPRDSYFSHYLQSESSIVFLISITFM